MHFKKIVQTQREFFNTGATNSVEFRKKQLKKLRDMITENKDRLADAIHADLHRPKPLCVGEIDGIINEIDYFLQNLDEWVKPEKKSTEPYGTTFIYKIPLGVILIISPFNFPIALGLRPLSAALASGNTIVLKPSELSENSSTILAQIIGATFPPELVIVVEGDAKVSQDLLQERYDHIFYTGSPVIGRIILGAAAKYLTPVTLELGGKCPCVILDDAPDIEKVAKAIVDGKWLNCGQVCLAVDYLILTEGIKQKFVTAFLAAIKNKFGDKPKESLHYARMINTNHYNRVMSMIKRTNGKLLYKSDDENDHDAKYVSPHVFEVSDENDALMDDEVFGPVISILTVRNLDEAIKLINKGEKPLATYIYSTDNEKIEKFFSDVHCGNSVACGIMLNYWSLQIPFGGVGKSGMGRYHGKYGFDTFTHEKATVRAANL